MESRCLLCCMCCCKKYAKCEPKPFCPYTCSRRILLSKFAARRRENLSHAALFYYRIMLLPSAGRVLAERLINYLLNLQFKFGSSLVRAPSYSQNAVLLFVLSFLTHTQKTGPLLNIISAFFVFQGFCFTHGCTHFEEICEAKKFINIYMHYKFIDSK
jgi:hypothetical protein